MVGSKGNMDESKRNRGLDSGSKVGQVGLVWLLQWVAGGSPTKATVPRTSLPWILILSPPCWGVAKESGYVECFKAGHTDAPSPAIEPDWKKDCVTSERLTLRFTCELWTLLTHNTSTYTAGKISIEHVTIFLSKYISKGAVDMKFPPDVGNIQTHTYKENKTNMFRN